MTSIIRWGLWDRRWSILGWNIGFAILVAMIILVYPIFRGQGALDQTLANIPEVAKAFVTDSGSFFSPVGYMSSQLFYMLMPLLLIILSIGLGSSLLSKEEQDGSLELLLARPISRSKIILSKALVGLIILGSVMVTSTIVTLVCAKSVNLGISLPRLAEACFAASLMSLLFGSIAFALVGIGRGGNSIAMMTATIVAFSSYLASSLDKVVHWLEWPAKVLPFHYYEPASIMNGTNNPVSLLVFVVIIIAFGIIAVVGFERRDVG